MFYNTAYGCGSAELDGCGPFHGPEKYQRLINGTGRCMLMKNGHWGLAVLTHVWCPFSYFRTSYDIQNAWTSMWGDLQVRGRGRGPP